MVPLSTNSQDRPARIFLGLQLQREVFRNFGLDMMAALTLCVFNTVFNQFYIPMAIRAGASDLQVGMLSAAPAIGMLLSSYWGSLLEGKKVKLFVVLPNLIGRASLLLVAFFTNPWMFVGVAILLNFLGGVQAPAYAALMPRIYPDNVRGRLMGYVRVSASVLLAPLAYLTGHLMGVFGQKPILFTAAVSGVVSIAIFALVRERMNEEPVSGSQAAVAVRFSFRDQWALIRENRVLWIFIVSTFVFGTGNLMLGPLYQIYQVSYLHLSNEMIGFTRVVYYALVLLSYPFAGIIVDRISPYRCMWLSMMSQVLVPVLYLAFGTYQTTMIACGFQGICDAFWDIGVMTFVFRIAPDKVSTVFGIFLASFGIRGTISPFLSTGLLKWIPIHVFFVAGAVLLVMGVVILSRCQMVSSSPVHQRAAVSGS